jgi:acyl-coenzyme A synthetase/AMP-(fatty) acid ligase
MPDEERGEIVKAFIILHDPNAAGPQLIDELQAHTKATTAPYKYPRQIEFVSMLPKTVSGKIQRQLLRKRATLK